MGHLTRCRRSVTMIYRPYSLKVMDLQLSLFPNNIKEPVLKKSKKAKLGRYEKIQRELATVKRDPYQVLVDIKTPQKPLHQFNFVDLFCGAGGMTQGLVQAGLTPAASVEISPIASATHTRNFPDCRHFCGDILSLLRISGFASVGLITNFELII